MLKEFFRIQKRKSKVKWNKVLEQFSINIVYKTGVKVTPRTVEVADAFGLGVDEEKEFVLYDNLQLEVNKDDIVYITGDSGSGKSVLLRWFKKILVDNAADLQDLEIKEDIPLVETLGKNTSEALSLLSRVGLNDAFIFLRTYKELSDGQKYRYRLAKLIELGKQFWVMDEFCSTLDRDTAKIVAFNVQKQARKLGKCVIAATTHTDLERDLHPSVHVHKRFGKEVTVKYRKNRPAKKCSLIRGMRVEKCCIEDWKVLARFHYRSHRVVAPRSFFCLKRGDELCGVVAYCYPPPACFGRKIVLPREIRCDMKKLNKKLSIISRVVVHPKYRSIGLGWRLLRDSLPLAGTPCVEMVAVMAKYNPFAEKAGMTKIVKQPPTREAVNIAEALETVGFNTQLLGSSKYALAKLQGLDASQLDNVKEAFIRNKQPRFMKQFFSGLPYGRHKLFKEKMREASLERLARLIKICGLLLQTKVYLFWKQHHRTRER